MAAQDYLVSLARPMRHEANNLLAAVSGTADIMLRSPARTERDVLRAERLREASVRLQALLQAYLALGAPPPAGTPAATVLETLRPLIGLMLGPGRAVEIAAAPDLPPLAATPQELQGIILNLARDAGAMAGPDAGIRVELARVAGGAELGVVPGPEPVFLAEA